MTAAAVTRVYLGLGSNLGDRLDHLRRGLFALAGDPGLHLHSVSRVYESEFVGDGAQPDYLNLCAGVDTDLTPEALLSICQGIEAGRGRPSDGHMKPRPLDIDLLLWGDQVVSRPGLEIPHPRASERAFVLEPLAEIGKSAFFPTSGETIGEACAKIRRKSGPWVRRREDLVVAGHQHAVNKEDWRAALAVHCR